MAMLKSINKYASAPAAPAVLPAGALLLVEIEGKVYKAPASAAAVASLPTSAAAASVGQVWSDNGVLKTKMS